MKKGIIGFVLGALIFGSVGVSAYTIFANDIGYTPSDTSWEVDNVKDAIDDLYNKANNLGNLQVVEYKGNNTNGTTIDVKIGDLIFVSSPASSYATNSEKLIKSLFGGSFNGIGTYTSVFKATSTNIKITTDNNCNFSYIVVRG